MSNITKTFYHKDLAKDVTEIKAAYQKQYPRYFIGKSADFSLDNPYAIDLEDTSYFYRIERERDEDLTRLLDCLKENK